MGEERGAGRAADGESGAGAPSEGTPTGEGSGTGRAADGGTGDRQSVRRKARPAVARASWVSARGRQIEAAVAIVRLCAVNDSMQSGPR